MTQYDADFDQNPVEVKVVAQAMFDIPQGALLVELTPDGKESDSPCEQLHEKSENGDDQSKRSKCFQSWCKKSGKIHELKYF